ncbi:hypothetical protein K503DRAFT_774224 [Rhizopogon vinicolor AM-OR11-026]|uniref:Uncharacterized protein n=1 Tax=Rhizopogon vinicolor AM-OR11-026 TaxID=1314800 RepID=A0A1B7MQ75_9AGAM|nr:hypothetical protein K503DRAFT_774224 [Rhizopogon vinicolor AM-OR11-026]
MLPLPLPLPLPLSLPLFCFPLPNQRLSSSNSLLLILICPQYSRTPSSSTSSPNHQRPRYEFKHFRAAQHQPDYMPALSASAISHNVHKCKNELLWDNKTPTSC